MEPVAIDLLWLRPGKVGGTESFIRNLLDGFISLEDDFRFVLLVSKDNSETFRHYEDDDRISLLEAPIASANISKRIIWQNLFQNGFLRRNGFKKCFEPVYCKPWFNGGIEYVCVIHDLQAKHYPEYHPLHEVLYSKLCWKMDTLNAKKIIAISEFVKKDIEETYGRKDIGVIYNPILVRLEDVYEAGVIEEKYGVENHRYLYTLSQLIPHKNLITLVKMLKVIKENADRYRIISDMPLIITGVNGNAAKELSDKVDEYGLKDKVILTGFIDNKERNTLYKYAHTFLFPSVFEGFGMPPVEAMYYGTRTITTRCASIPEVTQNKAIYVDDPYDEIEWADKLASKGSDAIESGEEDQGTPDFEVYDPKKIALQYLESIR